MADENNIDGLITYVLMHYSPKVISQKSFGDDYSYEYVYNAESVAEIIEEVFGVSDVNISDLFELKGLLCG